jgi:hypothetical protein
MPFFSSEIGEWSDFSAYISNLLNPLIAMYVLYFVIKTYRLQQTEFSNTTQLLRNQVDIDGLLRRQETISNLIDKSMELLSKSLNKQANFNEDSAYSDLFSAEDFFNFNGGDEPITVSLLLKATENRSDAGDYVDLPKALPGDFNELKNTIKYIDALCFETKTIDSRLIINSDIYTSSVSEATIILVGSVITPIVARLRKLGHLDTVNKDSLLNF